MTRRRGSSLVEVLVLIVTTAVMLGLAIGLIQILLRVDKAGRADLVEASEASRLALAFRADVRASTSARPVDQTLELEGPDGLSVRYRLGPGEVTRVRSEGGEARSRDTFRLPRHGAARFESSGGDGPTLLALIFEGRPGSGPAFDDRIEAALAADHRFEAGEGEGESP